MARHKPIENSVEFRTRGFGLHQATQELARKTAAQNGGKTQYLLRRRVDTVDPRRDKSVERVRQIEIVGGAIDIHPPVTDDTETIVDQRPEKRDQVERIALGLRNDSIAQQWRTVRGHE